MQSRRGLLVSVARRTIQLEKKTLPRRGRCRLVSVAFRSGEILAQLLRGPARAIPWRTGLNSPPFLQRSRIHRVVAEFVDQFADRRPGRRIVASNGNRAAILRA